MLQFLGLIPKLFGAAKGAYKTYQEGKNLKKRLQIQHDIKKLEANEKALSEGRKQDTDWELASLKNSSWKDEFWTIMIALPLPFVWFPKTQEAVLKGFEILNQTPDWYRWLLVTIVLAAFGIRMWRRL